MLDVFYFGGKPNVHPKEKFASSLDDARKQSTTEHFWIVNEFCIYTEFEWEFDWDDVADEDVWAQDHINIWPSLYQKDSGTWLCSKKPSDIKIYRSDVAPIKRRPTNNWIECDDYIDKSKFDFSWHHDPTEPPFIYKWGCKYFPVEVHHVLEYRVPGATQTKYMTETVDLLPDGNWIEFQHVNKETFDFSWRPDPREPPYIYVWGNKWVDGKIQSTLEYHTPNSIGTKYMSNDVQVIAEWHKWFNSGRGALEGFDFTWRPDPREPKYMYQFGTIADPKSGPLYIPLEHNGEVVFKEWIKKTEIKVASYPIKTTLDDLISEHPEEIFWALNPDIQYKDFNFDWRPSLEQAHYVHVFGSEEKIGSHTYFVNAPLYLKGNKDFNFVKSSNGNVAVDIDVFYIDRGNSTSAQRYQELKDKFGDRIQKTRFLTSWVDTINRCINKASSKLIWILNSELDYTNFDFNYYPNLWQMNMIHVFGTQWSHWGTTFMVNCETFPTDSKYVKIIEHLSSINFVKNIKAKATHCLHDIVLIDHGNKETEEVRNRIQQQSSKPITVIKYDNSYLSTMKSYIDSLPETKDHFLWICSSVCDYSRFDFTYICDPFSVDQLHVFPSNKQKFGDTFLVNVNYLRKINDPKINFNGHQTVQRLPAPILLSSEDTFVNDVKKIEGFPYAVLTTPDNADTQIDEVISLWDQKNILVSTKGATKIVVPKEAKNYINKELYDYPYISVLPTLKDSYPMDIVFLSNGEPSAEENWYHLLETTKGIKNRVSRVDGINGRVAAYHAAVSESKTPWCFTVFAKLKINEDFDWSWQPDRMQVPKHYIFYATNPLNGLEYGHQAMIAYNKKLVLANTGKGLDFTLDDMHEVVPLNSGIANFNTDEFSTWRTAFREVIKLKADTSLESKERLNIWLTKADGKFADFCLKGAKDASDYYDEVGGNFEDLKLSYEWKWLNDQFQKRS